MNYEKVKEFWVKNIKEKQERWGVKDVDFAITSPSWEERINALDTFGELDDLGRELRKEVFMKRQWKKTRPTDREKISVASENILINSLLEDLKEIEKKNLMMMMKLMI